MMSLQRIFGETDMENYSIWETIGIGMIALLAIFWFSPGIKAALERGKQVQADWPAVLIPLSVVALLVFFLILAS
jgi:predicted Co/Zn/Cd cation transporter (cation efflux family)